LAAKAILKKDVRALMPWLFLLIIKEALLKSSFLGS
jgi:hypothetical protein